MRDSNVQDAGHDEALLRSFEGLALATPSLQSDGTVANPTPIQDLTEAVVEAAVSEYGVDLSGKDLKIIGKLDSQIPGGSVKVRPAVQILRDAIARGELRRGQVVFEATSGNFGIALGVLLGRLGVDVVGLVSRKIQGGVVDELKRSGVKTIDLDVEVCPTPGALLDVDTLTAKVAAASVRRQLSELGFDVGKLDKSSSLVEALLAKHDVIMLAQLLAEVYGGYCPRQYDNEMNARAHELVTGPELAQQLQGVGLTLGDFRTITSFGTGGTSTGLSAYISRQFGRKSVHVVFPLSGQDVAGIRTRANAASLKFYRPETYAAEHEVDFEEARKMMPFLAKRGVNVGESSALNLYAAIQLANYGVGNSFLVMLADGSGKYQAESRAEAVARSVSFEQAKSSAEGYGRIIWTHPMFVPKEEGVKFLASALGREESTVLIMDPGDVQRAVQTSELPADLLESVRKSGGKHLFVCMAGVTSLRVGKAFASNGLAADNLSGGIMALAGAFKRQPAELLRQA